MRAIAIIPARLAATRLPRKPLRLIAGRPMIERVYRAVKVSPLLQEVIVATDSSEIYDFCQALGFPALMTPETCRSGTDRVFEAAQMVAADVYVNVQGDEPLAKPEHIAALLSVMTDEVQVGTLKTPMSRAQAAGASITKVVTDKRGRALYFSRLPIPFDRDAAGAAPGQKGPPPETAAPPRGPRCFKHLGFYAYRRAALEKFVAWPESELEQAEKLEQLRFLENGIEILVAETPFDTISVDTEQDLARVEEIMTLST